MDSNYLLTRDYEERVYAGILGKMIGVYLGLPVEGWTCERITEHFGEISYYVNGMPGFERPIVQPDDDLTGTLTFVRALEDRGCSPDITPAQIGHAWLNYMIEGRTGFWWGGLGRSTEHTAMLRLLDGIEAPESGSIATNGRLVAEQIGGRIFVDAWPMLAPGDPDIAALLAYRAIRVSHDGDGVWGGVMIAAMESQAFVERDMQRLIEAGLRAVPARSIVRRVTEDVCAWHAKHRDWREARARIAAQYGYDKFGGGCHMIPNHAIVMLGLLYGADDFTHAMTVTTTAGWDTDCNAGTVGCLLGIRDGLSVFGSLPDWREPVGDRLLLSTADGGGSITDALTEAYRIVAIARRLAGCAHTPPKCGARFHFSLPGSVQGFSEERSRRAVANQDGALCMRLIDVSRAMTPTFTPRESIPAMKGSAYLANVGQGFSYNLMACPTLYPGQTVRAKVRASAGNKKPVACALIADCYGADDALEEIGGSDRQTMAPGESAELYWRVPETDGRPVAQVGVDVMAKAAIESTVYLDWLTWAGEPEVTLREPDCGGTMWRHAWVDAFDHGWGLSLSQDRGTGLLIQGTRDWRNYTVSAKLTSNLCDAFGLAARVQGLRRYYALMLYQGNIARLLKVEHNTLVLAEAHWYWTFGGTYDVALTADGDLISAAVGGVALFSFRDTETTLQSGAIALVCERGSLSTDAVSVAGIPASQS